MSNEPLVAHARARKGAKYHDLVEAARAVGYKTELITVEVGSRGVLADSEFEALKKAIDVQERQRGKHNKFKHFIVEDLDINYDLSRPMIATCANKKHI